MIFQRFYVGNEEPWCHCQVSQSTLSIGNGKDIGYCTYLNHNTPWIDSQGSLEVFVVLLHNTLRYIIVISLSLTIKPILHRYKNLYQRMHSLLKTETIESFAAIVYQVLFCLKREKCNNAKGRKKEKKIWSRRRCVKCFYSTVKIS